MIKITGIKVDLNFNFKKENLADIISHVLGCKKNNIYSVSLLRKSIDARHKDNIKFVLTVAADVKNENKYIKRKNISEYKNFEIVIPKIKLQKRPVIIGFGPAGIFAALTLAEAGCNPIVLERGKNVDERLGDIKNFAENRVLNTESNVQFGEGGAGTFSDGKLNTGINSPYIKTVLETFIKFGAQEEILWDAKPHIGTDVLANIIKNIREYIKSLGGEILFNSKMTDFIIENNKIKYIIYNKNNIKNYINTDNLIIATGHSARDVFKLLKTKKIILTQKPFSVGVRIEHLQSDINKNLFGKFADNPAISPAAYKQSVHLKNGRGVYTFCMCPGGYVVPAASCSETVVTNGMSYSKRDGVNANSALLVGINPEDYNINNINNPLAGIYLQEKIEHNAFVAGGKNYNAPCILVGDFLQNKISTGFGKIKPTYKPGTKFAAPEEYLPGFICDSLREAIPLIGKKFKGFDDPEAVLTGAESRSTSPVRINRTETGETVSVNGIYPCGEGAGYAGGIVSAAVDGIKTALKIII